LLLLLLLAISAWRAFTKEQRILLVATFATWAWSGYGTKVPWVYKPFGRLIHFYAPLELGVVALLPAGLYTVLANRKKWAYPIVAVIIATHLTLSGAGGKFGAASRVSREMLRYANGHPSQVYLTDVATMNEMYVVGGFRFPANIVCENGPAVDQDLLVNKEPPGVPRFHFPDRPIDGILVNLERLDARVGPGVAPEFIDSLRAHAGTHTRIAPVIYKPLLAPLVRFVGPLDFLIGSHGAEVVMPYAGAFSQDR
jgi:hypothetical protein